MTLRFPGFRAASLAGAALFNALLLEGAPGLRGIDAVRLPAVSTTEFPTMYFLLTLTVGALVPVFFIQRARFLLLGSTITCITWSFAGASRVPWWFLDQGAAPLTEAPEVGAVVLASLSLVSVLGYVLVLNLEAYAEGAAKRGLDEVRIRPDLRRIAAAYAAVASFASIAGGFLVFAFEGFVADGGFVPELSGTAWGTWVLVLVGLLLGGVFLVLGRGARAAAPAGPAWIPVEAPPKGAP